MDPWDGGDGPRFGGDPQLGVDTDDVDALPEVREARAAGWEPAIEAPLWCFLPAVWPRGHRAWVPDRRVRHSTYSCSDGTSGRAPWGTWSYAEIEADCNRTLAACGFPPRPFGRIWLLRTVAPWGSVEQLLQQIVDDWGRRHRVIPDGAFAQHVQEQLARAFSA